MKESDQTINLNHNAAECIKYTSQWGETIYTNICSGAHSSVVWGGMDYFWTLVGIAFVGAGFIVVLSLVIMLLRD